MRASATERVTDEAINTLRILSLDQVQRAGVGHLGLPLAMAPALSVLFRNHVVVNPDKPTWVNRDRFVLSCGHGSALLYSLLHIAGFDLTIEDLQAFRQWRSRTPGHPELGVTPGVDMTTGPLGQGIANATGMAIAEEMARARLGADLINHHVYVLASDGDLMEGISFEAMSLAARLRLGRLIILYDDNDVVIDGRASMVFDAEGHLRALRELGWHVSDAVDANDLNAIDAAISRAREVEDRPSLIHLKSKIGYGSTLADTSQIHSGAVSSEEAERIRSALSWEHQEEFYVPDAVYDEWRVVAERGSAAYDGWVERSKRHPDELERLERWQAPFIPEEVARILAKVPAPEGAEATRFGSARLFQALASGFDNIVAGSADLVDATKVEIPGEGIFSPADRKARNIGYGVREHAMSAISNGLAAHGLFRPVASTFMMFASYQSNAMRMAALQQLPVIHVLTHDSIGVGEDGPTHQPVEVLSTLRATPNTTVFRPSSFEEAKVAWQLALENGEHVSVFALSRSNVRNLVRTGLEETGRAGLTKIVEVGKPDIVLLASGTEVDPAMDAVRILSDQGVSAALVSVLSHEIALRSGALAALHAGVPRLVIEASASHGLGALLDGRGGVHGTERFGESAPASVMFEKFGFTGVAIAARAQQIICKEATDERN